MTIASSTIKPDAMLSAISERLSSVNPIAHITPNVAISDTGSVTLGMSVAQNFRRNRKITMTTSTTVIVSVICTSATAARMVVVRSAAMSIRSAPGADFRFGQQRLDRVDNADDIRARLPFHVENQRGFAVVPGREFLVLEAFFGGTDVPEFDGSARAIGDDGVKKRPGIEQLVVGADLKGLSRAFDLPFRQRRRGGRDRLADVLERKPEARKLAGIDRGDLTAHACPLGADLANALDLRQFRIRRRSMRIR